jgi:hypothetical protein
MKKVIFTIIATIFLGVAADAQTKSAYSNLSLKHAIEVNFTAGTALSAKAAQAYTQTINTNSDKSFSIVTEINSAPLYTINIAVPVTRIIDTLIKSNAAGYIENSYSISVF